MELFLRHPLVQELHPVRLVAATSKVVTVHTPTMTPGRWIFLVLLAVFFCALFTRVYIWMRRPTFGDDGGARGTGRSAGNACEGASSEDGRPMLVRTASQQARAAGLPGHRLR